MSRQTIYAKISDVRPRDSEPRVGITITLTGENFLNGPPVPVVNLVTSGSPPVVTPLVTTYVSENELQAVLPTTLDPEEYEVYLVNGFNAIESNRFPFTVYSGSGARPRQARKLVDQRVQPLPSPFSPRNDLQRIVAGNQFNGRLPDAEPGLWGTGTGPVTGGLWRYNDDILIRQIVFKTNGPEGGAGRLAGSGFFLVYEGIETLLLDLSGTASKTENIIITDEVHLQKGSELRLVTRSATREMIAFPTIIIERNIRRS